LTKAQTVPEQSNSNHRYCTTLPKCKNGSTTNCQLNMMHRDSNPRHRSWRKIT